MYRVAKGGPITINSFLTEQDRNTAREHMLKTASKQMREAAKIGLQSLYADPTEVLEKYKDFDIVKEMKARKDAKLLWVRARSIDADTVNHNGDYFSKAELLKEVEVKGEKIPAYKTFEGVPIYTNHKNDDIEQAKGMVVYAEWDESENCVYCTFFVDEEAYPDIARNIRTGVIHDVSMGCFTAGTQVLTLNGFKNIELVNSEDELLDADGNLTKIINKQINYTKTHIHDIQVEGGYGFECTEEHPILAIFKTDWDKRSKRITSGNKKPRIYNFVEPRFIEAKDLRPGDLVAMKTGGQVIDSDLTENQAKILGLFAAEGNYLKYKGEVKEIEFTFSLDEEFTLVQECVSLIKSCFGKEARVYKREPKSTIVVRLYDESIANWFKYHIGQYSYGKTISKELRYAPLSIQKAFVCSWVKGDGCITHKTGKNQGISATTCSIDFAKDITYILTRLGIYHKIYARFENKTLLFKDAIKIHSSSKGFDGRHMSFDIDIPSTYANEIADECNFDINSGKVQRKNDNENYIVRKIKSNEIKSFNGPVYNFETESHTYSIHNIGVHNCSVAYGICSKCGNKAYTEKEYCSCLKKWKGKKENGSGKVIYEENYDLKFIELSCVGDGAFDACEIKEIYDVDDILNAATDAEKKASELISNIVIAQQGAPSDPVYRQEYEECLRVAETTTRTALRLAQNAGTLIGGQLMAGEGAGQNATVQAVLGALGIDPRSGLNILDLINLSLNFLEVAVMNMFARKDNVDLAHVGKITKSMADLQSTMQDMIDDGIDVGAAQGQQALNQQQLQQQPQQQQAQPAANTAPANYMPAGNVGRMIEPALFTGQPQGIGGAVALASSNHNLVWASKDGRREVFASTSTQPKDNSFIKLSKGLVQLKEALSDNTAIASVTQNVIRVANERNKNIRNNTPHSLRAEGNNQMDHFAKIASEQRKKLAAAVTIDFKVEDGAGNRVVLSTDGSITGFTNGSRSNWEPILSEQQLSAMESGQGARVAADLLKDFVKTAIKAPHMDKDVKEVELKGERKGVPYKVLADGVATMHADPHADKTREESLESLRKDNAEYGEEALTSAGLYGHKVNDDDVKESLAELVAQANKGVSEEGLNERIDCCRAEGSAPAHEVMVHTVDALTHAVVASYSTPSEIVEAATKLANEELLPELIATASAGTDVRVKLASKADFFKTERVSSSPVTAVLESLGDRVSKSVTAGDLAEALRVAASETEYTIETVTKGAELRMAQAKGTTSEAKAKISKSEELRTALRGNVTGDALISKNDLKSVISAMAMAAEETASTPEDVAEVVESTDEGHLIAEVNKARTASATNARLKSRARREFWGERVASKTDLSSNVIGWLADYATNFDLSTKSIVTAAKKLVSDGELAERLIVKAIETKQNAERTAAMQVTHETSDSIRFVCRTEDLDGLKPNDEGFEDAFRQKAMEVLQGNGFTVDPNTFSFTDLNVSAYGDITATVSSRTSKTFSAQSAPEVPTVGTEIGPEEMGEAPVVMTEEARMARNERRSRILSRFAQMAAPGGGMGAGMGAPAAPDMGMDAGAFGGPGISAMTTDPMAAGADAEGGEDLDAMAEPGEKKPWGTVCPVCGSDDVDVAESKGSCNSCGSTYEIQMSLKLISDGTGGQGAKKGEDEAPEGDMGELGGMGDLGAAGAPVGGPMGAPAPAPAAPPAPGMPGLPATASVKGLFRLAATVDADVYLETAKEGFNRTASKRLPIGMVCPKCGNREANKVKDTSFCHSCGNISKTTVAQNKNNPSKLDVTITWID